MRLTGLTLFLGGCLLAATLPAMAAGNDGFRLPPNATFRYVNDKGITVISSSLTEDALYAGYEILNANGRVVEIVPPGIPKAQREAMRKKQERKEQNQQLLRMYIGPRGAARTRDRKIEAIQLKMNYARNQKLRLQHKLHEQIDRAAGFQKRGADVPTGTQDLIDMYSGQLDAVKQQLANYKNEIQQITQHFDDIIKRLEKLTGETLPEPKPKDKTQHTSTAAAS